MKIRVIKPFGGYKAGQEFDWSDGMARVLIARRLIEEVESRDFEVATVEERAERAVQPQGKKRMK
jgi:hypothetical protein